MLRKSRFLGKLFACQLLLIATTAVIAGWIGESGIERLAREELEQDLRRRATLVAAALAPAAAGAHEAEVARDLRRLAEGQGVRLTLIAADGSVLADSHADPLAMDNQSLRVDVAEVLRTNAPAFAWPQARTPGALAYASAPVFGPERSRLIVRLGAPPIDTRARARLHWDSVLTAALIATALGSAIVWFVARQIAQPLRLLTEVAQAMAAGDYQRRVRVPADHEVGRLAEAFNSMADQLQARMDVISTDRHKLLAILGSMVEAVIAVDRNERVLHMNHVAGILLDARPEASVGRPIWQVTRSMEVINALAETIRSGGETTGEIVVPEVDGDRTIEIHGSPLRDHAQQVVGAILVLHDVTRIRRLEAMRRDFVANVSHELKTPLAAIRGLLETILDDPQMDGETRERFLRRSRDQAMRLSTLVSDLLTLSRVEARDTQLESVVIDLRDIVRESVQALERDALDKGLTLAQHLPPVEVSVRGDAEGLRQVVDNLVNNAIKYTNAGGRVDVRLHCGASEATLAVEDTGIGIARRDLDRIFERFYRVDKARSRELGSTGLGLAIVKNITLRHGGQVDVESTLGRGSTFRITLPLSLQSA